MLRATPPLALLLALAAFGPNLADGSHIKSVSAAVDRRPQHHNFVPLVAFKCGYRNQYLNESGDWQTDPSSVATCLQGKLDILKYCKRVYPDKKITNIVEYNHISQIPSWCDEDTGKSCAKTFYIRPYRCLEGEFTADSLQVPSRCRFGHVSGRDTCEDFRQWRQKGEQQCGASQDQQHQRPMRLHSFGLLEPCGLSLFRGVEYVCCPKDVEDKYVEAHLDEIDESMLDSAADEDEEDDEDEEEDEDEDASAESSKSSAADEQDAYFTEDAAANEHERYRDALERLEKRHRSKVTAVITQWSELFERYNKMRETDPKAADVFKDEMTGKFRRTVGALEDENKKQRRQLEEVHDQRVQDALNEKKRKATHDYRLALALQVGHKNKKQVLKTLKDYIRAEEKDRAHMLNRYRHLLRTSSDAAGAFEPMLLHRLRYIDLRINGTLAMLRDFPELERQLRPIAEEFWREYRKENTPELEQNAVLDATDAADSNERLIKLYKQAYEHSKAKTNSVSHTAKLVDSLVKESRDKEKKTDRHDQKTQFVSLDELLADKHQLKKMLGEDKEDKKDKKDQKPKKEPKQAELDSDEDQFEEDDEAEDESAEQQKKDQKQDKGIKPSNMDKVRQLVKQLQDMQDSNEEEEENKEDKDQVVHKEPIQQLKLEKPKEVKEDKEKVKKLPESDELSDEEEDDEEDSDEEDEVREQEAHVVVNNEDLFVRKEVGPSFSRHDHLVEYYPSQRFEESSGWSTPTTLVILGSVVLCAMGIVGLVLRSRPRGQGFVEVDVCSPEDGQVDKMQVNGYENPTYNFYDAKP